MYWWFDPTYILVIIALIISLVVQGTMQSTFNKYSRVRSMRGMTGEMVARSILESEGLYNVRIERVAGNLTDHYDPRSNVVRLSQSVFGSTSLAAVGVAAHECGHAIQHARNYKPLSIRSSLVPAANIGSQLSWPLFLIGLILSYRPLLLAGIILFCAALLFQLVTLPVEINASRRALGKLQSLSLLGAEEMNGARKVLRAAAMTYVAAVAASLLQLLRLLLLSGAGRNRD